MALVVATISPEENWIPPLRWNIGHTAFALVVVWNCLLGMGSCP